MIKFTVTYNKKSFGTWQFGKIGVLVNFIIKKLKSKHLLCLSFIWRQVFLREREEIFYTYSGPKGCFKNLPVIMLDDFCTLSDKPHKWYHLNFPVLYHNEHFSNVLLIDFGTKLFGIIHM